MWPGWSWPGRPGTPRRPGADRAGRSGGSTVAGGSGPLGAGWAGRRPRGRSGGSPVQDNVCRVQPVPDELTRVSVSEVRTAVPTAPGVEAGMVTLREDEPPHRTVPIVIGQPEARAIQSAWTGTVPR